MKSLDTNILLYAINKDCPEHESCLRFVKSTFADANSWIIADQVWFELYRLLRNPTVLAKPLSAEDAANIIHWYQNKTGWLHCAWEHRMMPELSRYWQDNTFPARRSFDLILALTLKNHGVTEFNTRNSKDFLDFNFFRVINPLSSEEPPSRPQS